MQAKETSAQTPEGVRRKGLFIQMVPLSLLGRQGVISTIRMAAPPPADQPLPPGLRPLHGIVLPPASKGLCSGRGSPHLRPLSPPLL